jgi:hypothetical protein
MLAKEAHKKMGNVRNNHSELRSIEPCLSNTTHVVLELSRVCQIGGQVDPKVIPRNLKSSGEISGSSLVPNINVDR